MGAMGADQKIFIHSVWARSVNFALSENKRQEFSRASGAKTVFMSFLHQRTETIFFVIVLSRGIDGVCMYNGTHL